MGAQTSDESAKPKKVVGITEKINPVKVTEKQKPTEIAGTQKPANEQQLKFEQVNKKVPFQENVSDMETTLNYPGRKWQRSDTYFSPTRGFRGKGGYRFSSKNIPFTGVANTSNQNKQ